MNESDFCPHPWCQPSGENFLTHNCHNPQRGFRTEREGPKKLTHFNARVSMSGFLQYLPDEHCTCIVLTYKTVPKMSNNTILIFHGSFWLMFKFDLLWNGDGVFTAAGTWRGASVVSFVMAFALRVTVGPACSQVWEYFTTTPILRMCHSASVSKS